MGPSDDLTWNDTNPDDLMGISLPAFSSRTNLTLHNTSATT